jgi:nitrite reductase/ring-hydroxylating ferredoxin subunit
MGASAGEPLAADLYTGPEAFQRERRSIFGNTWLLLARTGAVAKPGDYLAQSLGGWPVLAIADPGGTPRVFRNTCRHQKLPLFDTGTGHCQQIRCRYHGWTYDIAGRFLAAPPAVAPSGQLSHDLERLAAQEMHGLLFVHLDDEPPALADALTGLASALAEATLETRGFHAETVTDIDVNWKLVMEQALASRPVDAARTVAWPSLILDLTGDGAVLHQVIARSFHRTRIHHLQYGAPATAEWSARDAARWRAGALARQSALETGGDLPLPVSPELEAFRNRVRAAHADGPPT